MDIGTNTTPSDPTVTQYENNNNKIQSLRDHLQYACIKLQGQFNAVMQNLRTCDNHRKIQINEQITFIPTMEIPFDKHIDANVPVKMIKIKKHQIQPTCLAPMPVKNTKQ